MKKKSICINICRLNSLYALYLWFRVDNIVRPIGVSMQCLSCYKLNAFSAYLYGENVMSYTEK